MISKKAKYALKALKVLAREYEKGPLLISNIAESENIPKKFLEAILLGFRDCVIPRGLPPRISWEYSQILQYLKLITDLFHTHVPTPLRL